MNDKQRIKELERDGRITLLMEIVFVVLFFFFVVFLGVKLLNLKQQNAELEGVLESIEGKWVLKMECQDWLDIDYIYLEESFDKYEDYEFALDALDEDCEVLE